MALAALAGGGGVLWADQTQRDPDGYFWVIGRSDDAVNVSGQTPVWVTAQALIALTEKTFPVGG